MYVFDRYYYDLLALGLGLVLLNGALTGKFHNHGKGRKRLIADVKSSGSRLAFLCVAVAILAWLVRDMIGKLA